MKKDSDNWEGWEAYPRRLKDGTRISILRLCDSPEHRRQGQEWLRRHIIEGYGKLSKRSRQLRFISPPHHLAPRQLDYLADLNSLHSMIWVARDDGPNEPVGVGLARCMRLTDELNVAELALTVLDKYQNKGVGRAFLKLMAEHCGQQGLTMLIAYVLPENKAMLHLLSTVGAMSPKDEDGLLRVDLPLSNRDS